MPIPRRRHFIIAPLDHEKGAVPALHQYSRGTFRSHAEAQTAIAALFERFPSAASWPAVYHEHKRMPVLNGLEALWVCTARHSCVRKVRFWETQIVSRTAGQGAPRQFRAQASATRETDWFAARRAEGYEA